LKQKITTFVTSTILVACASLPLGNPQEDATLKKFAIEPDRSGVFIYSNERFPSGLTTDIHLDGTPVGQISEMTYLYTPVAAGKHTITSKADNTDTLVVEITTGSLVYVRQQIETVEQEVEVGVFSHRVRLHLMSEEEGKKGVLDCKLAMSTLNTQVIEVQVVADNPAWNGPLECQAANSFGTWGFVAPGALTVHPSVSPLKITCKVPAGSSMDESATGPQARDRLEDSERKGAISGAKVGAGVGIGVGVVTAPVMGPGLAAVLVIGSAFQGAEIGGLLGAVAGKDEGAIAYPSPVIIHIRDVDKLTP